MKAVVVHEHGGLDALSYEDVPEPTPAADEVLVRVRAVGVNHLDLWVRKGVPGARFPLPMIPGSDVAGEVVDFGNAVRGITEGDRVVLQPGYSCERCPPCFAGQDPLCRRYGILGESRDGGCAEFIAVRSSSVVPMPESDLGFEEWAAVPLTFLTAWHMLVGRAALRPGEDVLIHAAGSGVSAAGIQIAKLLGARVMTTASSEEKLARARDLGADATVNYREEDFGTAVKAWTKKRGVDVVFDHVGADTFGPSVAALAKGGRYVTCGATSGFEMKTDFRLVFFKGLSILGSTMGSKGEVLEIVRHVAAGRLKPVVDRVLPLEKVAEAHRALEAREAFGKVVLVPGGGA
jgi:NADPH:quinone reductase-like Zn-dependent oxidoreductase